MKYMISTLVVLIIATISYGSDLQGWENMTAHKEGEQELEVLPIIKIISHTTSNACVEVTNQTGVNLEYGAYGESLPQLFFKTKENGVWVPSEWDWCGTGLSEYTLKDKSTVVLKVHFPTYEKFQVFTIIRLKDDVKHYSLIKLYEKNG